MAYHEINLSVEVQVDVFLNPDGKLLVWLDDTQIPASLAETFDILLKQLLEGEFDEEKEADVLAQLPSLIDLLRNTADKLEATGR